MYPDYRQIEHEVKYCIMIIISCNQIDVLPVYLFSLKKSPIKPKTTLNNIDFYTCLVCGTSTTPNVLPQNELPEGIYLNCDSEPLHEYLE